MAIKISALEYYLPDDIVTNDDLKKENPDWDLDSVEKNTIFLKVIGSYPIAELD